MKELIYRIYKKFETNKCFATVAYIGYNLIFNILNKKDFKYDHKRIKFNIRKNNLYFEDMKEVKIAFLCDEMTYEDFKDECNAVFVTPFNWLNIFENFKPDIFFCESAWSGIEKYKNSWRGKVYKNNNIYVENRKDILNILDYCKRSNIKTVFWNKEDPTFFGSKKYDFVNTALKFQYIFTTCQECLEKYKAMGHDNVYVLTFGFSPNLFNPVGSRPNDYSAVFAGSWYNNQKERCLDMDKLFDMILNKDIPLKIIDRHYLSNNPINKFPDKYCRLIDPGVAFSSLGNIMKKYKFGININTVKDSDTMFARRVFEMMACNMLVVSNESIGMEKMFGNKIWYSGEEFDFSRVEKICNENLKDVFLNHTCKCRLYSVMNGIGVNVKEKKQKILIIYLLNEDNDRECKTIFDKTKTYAFYLNGKLLDVNTRQLLNSKEVKECDFFIVLKDCKKISNIDFEFLISQYSYLDDKFGIGVRENIFNYTSDNLNYNVLFSRNYLEDFLKNPNVIMPKFSVTKKMFYKDSI